MIIVTTLTVLHTGHVKTPDCLGRVGVGWASIANGKRVDECPVALPTRPLGHVICLCSLKYNAIQATFPQTMLLHLQVVGYKTLATA